MDVLSQAVLGASLSQSFSKDKSKLLSALLIGALAGMAPDLDILLQSPEDSLLFLEFHRQFTHSLIFIPFGALICTLVFYLFVKNKLSFSQVYLFAFLGFATHGMLDACTSYGTQLFWPFSNQRVSWNIVSIVDPFFTIPILIGVWLAAYRKKRLIAQIVFVYAVVFLSLGHIQKQRVEYAINSLAEIRGHETKRLLVKPSFANRHVWKALYEHNERYYVDAVKVTWDTKIIEGTSTPKLNVTRDFKWLDLAHQQATDIERFRWFSGDYLAVDVENENLIFDVRYSLLPNEISYMWGIELSQEKINGEHVDFKSRTGLNPEIRKKFIDILF